MHWRYMRTDDLEQLRDDIDDELSKRNISDDRIKQATGNTEGEQPS
jgi:hypothetical protein